MSNLTIKLPADQILIFALEKDLPVYMFTEGRFWIRLESIAEWLSAVEQVTLLLGDVRIFLNDPAAGTYIRLRDYYMMADPDMQIALEEQKARMMKMIRQECGR